MIQPKPADQTDPVAAKRKNRKHIFDPRQSAFIRAYMDEQSPTYSNAYQSAVKAGYSPDYANQITAMGNEWLQDVIRPQLVSKSEVIMGVKRIANSRRQRTGDRLKGYELLGKHLKLWGGDSVIGEGITITLGSAKPETIEGELVDTPLLEAG